MIRTLLPFAVLILFLPLGAVEAYVTTDQAAVQVTGTSAIYLIEFEFGHGDHEIHIPVTALNVEKHGQGYLSYALTGAEGERIDDVDSAGIVLADAPIENGEYVLPEGVKTKLTLMVVARVSEDHPTEPIHLSVTDLPFSFDGENELELNDSELQYYTTPPATLPIIAMLEHVEFSIK